MKPLLATLFAVTILTGCASAPFFPEVDSGRPDAGVQPPTDGGVASDGGLAVTDACRALNTSRCAFLARCGLIEGSASALADCRAGFEATWCGPLTWPSHVAAGALRFDGVKAQACAEAFTTQACGEWTTLPDSCANFLKPRAQLGQPCYDGYLECADGVCRGNACPRTCQPRALLDEPCALDADCRTGLFCRFATLMATTGMCAAFSGIGGSCDGANRCLDGLQCVNLQCRALPVIGGACLDGLCAEQAWCDLVTADGGICLGRKTVGLACNGDECQAGLLCEPLSGRCQPRALSSGDACTERQLCPDGEACVGVTTVSAGVCGAPLAVGAPCTSNPDCQAHLACLAADGGLTCQPRAKEDAGCTVTPDCQASAICRQGACVELPLPGESCADTRTCRWGLCREVTNTDGGAVCGGLLSAGQGCVWDAQCASASCDRGTCLARCLP